MSVGAAEALLVTVIQEAVKRCQSTGGVLFVDAIEQVTGARIEMRAKPGQISARNLPLLFRPWRQGVPPSGL